MSERPPISERDAALLREFLAGRDERCPTCQYELRDFGGKQCPECGAVLFLSLGASSFQVWVWIVSLIGATVGSTFSAAFVGVLIHEWVMYGGAVDWFELWPCVIGGVLELGAFCMLLITMKQYWRMRPKTCVDVALGVWGLTLAIVVLTYYLLP